MTLSQRLTAAWRALTGKRDAYAATYGNSGPHGFAGGAINRLTSSLSSWSGSLNADLDVSLPILRARAQPGCQQRAWQTLSLAGGDQRRRTAESETAGARHARPAQPNKPTTLDKSANDAIEAHWERWGEPATFPDATAACIRCCAPPSRAWPAMAKR